VKILKSIYIKLISWALFMSFIFVYVLNDYTYAAKYIEADAMNKYAAPIEVPLGYGKVLERHSGRKLPGFQVVLMQDLHANLETQKNIRGILGHIHGKYGLERVGVEGSSERVDTSLIGSIPDASMREEVIDYFMGKGYVTGAEAFAVDSGLRVLEGLEDEELYDKNSDLLVSSLNHRNEFVSILERVKYVLREIEDEVCCSDLKKFRGQHILYRQKKLSTRIFHKYVAGWIERTGRTVGELSPEYWKYMRLTEKYDALDVKKVKKEYAKLVKSMGFTGKNSGEDSEKTSRINLTDFSNFMKAPADIRREMIERVYTESIYGNLRKYVDCMELSRQINSYRLLEEENRVVKEVSYSLCKSGAEKDFVFVSDYVQLLVKFLLNQMTPVELGEFYGQSEEFLERDGQVQ